jgi:hypothetical protein
MGASPKVLRFRRELAADLKSAKNAGGVVGAVDAIATSKDLLACLDVWCDAFDPADWPVKRQQKEEPQFNRARTAGYLLFHRAIELANAANGLAEMVGSMPRLAWAHAPPGSKEARYVRYARRYASLDDGTRERIVLELQSHLKERAETASQKRAPD